MAGDNPLAYCAAQGLANKHLITAASIGDAPAQSSGRLRASATVVGNTLRLFDRAFTPA